MSKSLHEVSARVAHIAQRIVRKALISVVPFLVRIHPATIMTREFSSGFMDFSVGFTGVAAA